MLTTTLNQGHKKWRNEKLLRGLYTATSGMLTQTVKQDVIANNIANVNTSGYKKNEVIQESFPSKLLSIMEGTNIEQVGKLGTGVSIVDIATNFEQGNLEKTDNPLDLALANPNTYLSVETESGVKYTRDGSLKINSSNKLVTSGGHPVLGSNGHITIEGEVRIDPSGDICVGEEVIDKLAIYTLDNPQKIGDNLFESTNQALAENANLQIGYLEKSNVNIIKEMVSMISAVRSYEMCQKAIETQDNSLNTLINKVGQV